MSLKIIRKAFETRLATYASANSIPVAYENVSFTPVDGAYFEAFMIPAQTGSQYLAQNDKSFSGIAQINIYTPLNSGTDALHNYAQSISALYNIYINQDSLTIYTLPAYELPADRNETHFVIGLRIPYRCEVA